MQKDVHFYLTYALSKIVGIDNEDAEKIAWANQYTDDVTKTDVHGIQTQCAILGDWNHKPIQLSVLIPFHFIPGTNADHPWMTTRNNWRARKMVEKAGKNPFQIGIALHGLQDTYSHEGFSGWEEELNACFPWYYIDSIIPNIGHAELRVAPDVVNYIWTDPRTGLQVDNKERAMAAAKSTYTYLSSVFHPEIEDSVWIDTEKKLQELFKISTYDERKQGFRDLSGNKNIKYDEVNNRLKICNKPDFVRAASNHLAEAMNLLRELPWK